MAGAPEDFKLEYYKFILKQINELNGIVHKQLALFQKLAAAVLGAGAILFMTWKELKIPAVMAFLGIRTLELLFIVLTVYLVASVVAGICSWFDFRKEEVELLDEVVKKGYRKMPDLKNIWRWQEFYLLLFVVLTAVVIVVLSEVFVVPEIK